MTKSINLPSLMKAIVLNKANQAIDLSEVNLPLPECGDNELLIKVEYVGLNPVDACLAQNGFCHWQYPHVLGLDAVGTVVKAAKGIYPNVGQRVMWHASLGGQGVLSEYVKAPNYALSVVPDTIDAMKAAVLPCAGMSALIALEKLRLEEGETILIEAGAGAVGQFAIQFAKARGADVFTTASKVNHKLVKALGADAAFDYQDPQLCEKIRRELGPQGFDAVLDSVGGDATIRNIELMRFCGRIACLKALPLFDPELIYQKSPTINIVSLGGAWLDNSLCAQQKMGFMSKLLLNKTEKGELQLPKIQVVEFEANSISMALQRQIAGGFTGKQVVRL